MQHRTLGQLAREGHDQDREQAHIDFVNRRLVRFLGQLRLGEIDFLADVQHCLIGIEPGREFQGNVRPALESGGAHFLHAFDAAQLGFHRL